LSAQKQHVVFLLLVAAVAAVGFALARTRAPQGDALLDAVPRASFLVATADVGALRGSPLARPLESAGLAALVGVGDAAKACGFDPLARAHALVVAIPEGEEGEEKEPGEFGVAFATDFARDELVSCAEKVMGSRGGRPKTSTRGGFTLLEDDADVATKHPKIAWHDPSGPLVVARGAWLEKMLDAFEGKGARLAEATEHVSLRDALATRIPGVARPALVVTAILPKALRERLKREMGAEIAAEGDAGANAAMGGVLGVDAVGIAVDVGAAGRDAAIVVEMRCESASACGEVKKLIEQKRLAFSKNFGARLLGLGPLVDSLSVDVAGTSLSARAHAPTDEMAKAIERLLEMRSKTRPTASPLDAGASPPLAPSLAPSTEILQPPRP
jgi:hypothetical protein